jgi:hypothetical protein
MPGDFIMPTRTKQHAAPKAASAATQEPQPERDVDEIRAELALRIVRLAGQYQWPACPRRQCRRQRFCAAVNYQCANPRPAPEMTEEKERAVMGHLKRALTRRAAALGVAG